MAAVTWCIAFPYCPNEPVREAAFELVSAFYARHFPDIPQRAHSATPKGEPFLRAKTRNELVEQAETFDVIALIDADTLIHPETLADMVATAHGDDMFLGKPFLRGLNLPIDGQRQLAKGSVAWPRGQFNDPGAAWVIRPSSWWAAGGMDEGFTSWGGEDGAFLYMFAALGGTTQYGTHGAVKTEHEQARWRAQPNWAETLKRELVTQAIWERHQDLAKEWLEVRHQAGIVDQWWTRLRIKPSPRHRRVIEASA